MIPDRALPQPGVSIREVVRLLASPLLVLGAVLLMPYLVLAVSSTRLDARQFSSLTGLVLAAAVPVAGAVYFRSGSHEGTEPDAGARVTASTVRREVGWTAIPALLVGAASPAVARLAHVETGVAMLLVPLVAMSIPVGRQSTRLIRGWRPAWAIASLGAGVVASIAVSLALRPGVRGSLIGLMAGPAVFLAVLTWRGLRGRPASPLPSRVSRRESATDLWTGASLALLGHLDLLLAVYFLAPGPAKAYVGYGLTARLMAGLTVLLVLVTLRRSGDRNPIISAYRVLQTIAGRSALILLAVMVLTMWPTHELGFWSAAGTSRSVFLPASISVGVAALGVAAVLGSFHAVVDSRAYRLTVASVVGALVGGWFFHSSPTQLSLVGLAAFVGAAGVLYQAAASICRWTPPLSKLRPHEEMPSRRRAGKPDASVELSVVVPCHNAGPALTSFLERLETQLRGLASNEIIVVSDGSTDDTVHIAEEFDSEAVRVFHYLQRSGKGHALRVGLSQSRGAYVAFIDADGDIDPNAIGPFLTLMKLYEPDIVLGSKRHPLSDVRYPPLRRVMSWTYHKIARVLFRVNVRDTQTGLKLIRQDVLALVLPRMLEKRFAFDLELLVVARMLGFRRVFEGPVRIDHRFSSHVDPQAAFKILLDTAAIFYRRYVLNTYGHAGDRIPAAPVEQITVG